MTESLSLLAKAPPPRDLPIALAHCYAAATTPERTALLNRIYYTLSTAGRMVCWAESLRLGEVRRFGAQVA